MSRTQLEGSLLGELSNELLKLSVMEDYNLQYGSDLGGEKVHLTWQLASACNGYGPVRKEVEQLVGEELRSLIQRVINRQRTKVLEAREKLDDFYRETA